MRTAASLFVTTLFLCSACKGQPEAPPAESIAAQVAAADARLAADGYADAKQRYEKILEQDPNNSDAYRGLGQIQNHEMQYEQAVASLQKAISLNAQNADAYAALGFAQEQLKQFPAAAQSYAKAHELLPTHGEWTLAWAHNLRLSQKLDEAEKVLTELTKDDPDVKYVYTELGDTQRAAGRLDDALRNYMKAQAQHASDKSAWAGAAEVYEAKGETTLALNEWAEYIRRDCCSEFSKSVARPRLARLKKLEENGEGSDDVAQQ